MFRRVRIGLYPVVNTFIKSKSVLIKQRGTVRMNVENSFKLTRRLESTFQTPCNLHTSYLNWTCKRCRQSNMRYILMCSKCQQIINPIQAKTFTYFEIMDQDTSFDINTSELSKHFRRLQSHLHPDKFVKKDELEQAHSLDVSAMVNEAYQTLLKPSARAAYLLELNGKPFQEKSVKMDLDFLSDIMDLNERVSACANLEEARKLKDTNDCQLKVFYDKISDCFRRNNLDDALLCLAKLTYFENVNEKLKDVVMDLS